MTAVKLGASENPVTRKTVLIRSANSSRLRQRGLLSARYRERWVFPVEQIPKVFLPQARTSRAVQRFYEPHESRFQALIINASEKIASVMTDELEREIPGCMILYAPTLALARWLLKRRQFQLVVTSPMLPDGSVAGLRSALHRVESPPDLVVVGENEQQTREFLKNTSYHLSAMKNVIPPKRQANISELGADLRNDLNNPLQEIVAMVFVAKVENTLSEQTKHALNAIERAAKGMAEVVWKLEDKIMKVAG